MLISRYALDCKPYNETFTAVTWETCSLRNWLNDDFYKKAFGKKHRDMIKTANVSADKNPNYNTNPGNATQDKVFLLSITEAEAYFIDDESRLCAPTEYAEASGVYVNPNSYYRVFDKIACSWVLRSPGTNDRYVGRVTMSGMFDNFGYAVGTNNIGVRPAILLDLTA